MRFRQTVLLLPMVILLTACQTLSTDDFLIAVGLKSRHVNPDDITAEMIEMRASLATYVSNVRAAQKNNQAIRNFQSQLESIDDKLRSSQSPYVKRDLLINFRKILERRNQSQEFVFKVAEAVYVRIEEDLRKRDRLLSKLRVLREKYGEFPEHRAKYTKQRQDLIALGQALQNLASVIIQTEQTSESLYVYTSTYDREHPKISRQAL